MKWLLLIILISSSGESESEVYDFETEKACLETKIELSIKDEAREKGGIFAECFSEKDLNEIKINP